jgi:myo-inositol 2-dehydrogenase / D-chiro-inositol 1-dehydrogenase
VIRLGFAGAGFIANHHANALAAISGVSIAAVQEPDPARADAFASTYGAVIVPSLDALIESVDALYICSPNTIHTDSAVAALDAGVHVFCEKPPAVSLADAQRIVDAAARAKGVYQLGLNQRFAPVHIAVKEQIDSGAMAPRWAHVKMNRGQLLDPPWVADDAVTGGFLFETAIHTLDVLMWLIGPVREVVCRAARTCSEQLDDFAMLLTFESGVTATFGSSGHTTPLFPFQRIEIYGDYATAVTEEADRVTFQIGVDAAPEVVDVSATPWVERFGYVAEDRAFIAATRGEVPAPVTASDAYRVIELIDACYRAAESGEAIKLTAES